MQREKLVFAYPVGILSLEVILHPYGVDLEYIGREESDLLIIC